MAGRMVVDGVMIEDIDPAIVVVKNNSQQSHLTLRL